MKIGMTCGDCEHLLTGSQRCEFEQEKHLLKDPACDRFETRTMAISTTYGNMIVISQETMAQNAENSRKMGEMILQLGGMITAMQNRLDRLEERERAVTLSHAEVKDVMLLIRNRSAEYCEKYGITSTGCLRSVSTAIKKAVLTRYGVKDLHDVPAIARQAVEAQISRWSDIRLMTRCRERLRGA